MNEHQQISPNTTKDPIPDRLDKTPQDRETVLERRRKERDEISLRKISSLDHSPTFSDKNQKRVFLKEKSGLTLPEIPSYPVAPKYKNNGLKRLYTKVRYISAIIRQKMSGRQYPVISIIVVNNTCNWDCGYCFGDYRNRRDKDYSTDEIKYLIDQLYNKGVRYLNLHGGETLLRNDIGDLCNYVKQKGMYLCVITNGSLLKEKIDDIRCADNITISLDGDRHGNDLNRGAGTFDAAMSAIDVIKENKVPLRVSVTITKHTMNDIGWLARFAKEKDLKLIFSILFKPLKKAHDCRMTDEEIRTALAEVGKYRKLGYPIHTGDKSLDAALTWPYDYDETHHVTEDMVTPDYQKHRVPCSYGKTKFTIEGDGYVYPCFLTTDGSFQPKNWKEVGLDEALAHVTRTNTCTACPALTQNDHNALLDLNPKQVGWLVLDHVKGIVTGKAF